VNIPRKRFASKVQKKDTFTNKPKALSAEKNASKLKIRTPERSNSKGQLRGTNSALKRARGVNNLESEVIIKSKLYRAKIIAITFYGLAKFLRGYDRRKARSSSQGFLLLFNEE
jgi:hypothetical protein